MNAEKFENHLKRKTYLSKGKVKRYKTAAIQSRISCIEKVEQIFGFNIDTLICNRSEVINLLIKLRKDKCEDLRHTPLSNAVRHYYECMTGDKIERIF